MNGAPPVVVVPARIRFLRDDKLKIELKIWYRVSG